MPPPATPSPHRFLAARDKKPAAAQAQAQAQPHPPSSLRRAYDTGNAYSEERKARDGAASPRVPGAQTLTAGFAAVNGTGTPSGQRQRQRQFKQTPRFAVATPQRARSAGVLWQRGGEGEGAAGAQLDLGRGWDTGSALRGVGRKLSRVESIDDASQETTDGGEAEEEDDEVMLLDDEGSWNVVRSVEGVGVGPPDCGLGGSGGDGYARKRRRLTPKPDAEDFLSIEELQDRGNGGIHAGIPVDQDTMPPPTTTDHQTSLHGAPSTPRPTRAPPFVLPSGPTPTQPQTIAPRPRNPFILPPSFARMTPGINDPGGANSTAEPTNPLPEHFSPHRRNQKFLPGGMADTVRGWVLNVGQSNEFAGYAGGEQLFRGHAAARIRVEKVFAADGAARWVCGRSVVGGTGVGDEGAAGEDVRVMLLGQGRNGRDVGEGEGVVIVPPSWDVEVGPYGDRWRVAVDWRTV